MSIPKNELIQMDRMTEFTIPQSVYNYRLVERHVIKKWNGRTIIKFKANPTNKTVHVEIQTKILLSRKNRQIETNTITVSFETWLAILQEFKLCISRPTLSKMIRFAEAGRAETEAQYPEFFNKHFTRKFQILEQPDSVIADIFDNPPEMKVLYPSHHNDREVDYVIEFYDTEKSTAHKKVANFLNRLEDVKYMVIAPTDDGVIPVVEESKVPNYDLNIELPPDQWDGVILGTGTDGPRQIVIYKKS